MKYGSCQPVLSEEYVSGMQIIPEQRADMLAACTPPPPPSSHRSLITGPEWQTVQFSRLVSTWDILLLFSLSVHSSCLSPLFQFPFSLQLSLLQVCLLFFTLTFFFGSMYLVLREPKLGSRVSVDWLRPPQPSASLTIRTQSTELTLHHLQADFVFLILTR